MGQGLNQQQREHLNGALKKQIFSISLDSGKKHRKTGRGFSLPTHIKWELSVAPSKGPKKCQSVCK